MSECEKEACCSVETSAKKGREESDCPMSSEECPVEKSVGMWSQSFFAAMQETQVDILKEKIKKQWGPQMDKTADAVIEAFGVCWQSTLAKAKAQMKLRDDIRSIFEKSSK